MKKDAHVSEFFTYLANFLRVCVNMKPMFLIGVGWQFICFIKMLASALSPQLSVLENRAEDQTPARSGRAFSLNLLLFKKY